MTQHTRDFQSLPLKTLTGFLLNLLAQEKIEYTVRNLFRILAISIAVLHTWAAISSQSMNSDGISYLDIGDAYFRGDWENAINPVWPPLYSWILGLGNFVFKPSMEWEFPTVHIINFAIFVVALVSFEYMWGKLGNFTFAIKDSGRISLPKWSWWAIGYSLFIWTALNLIQIWAVTPDMLMAALVFLAAGLVIRIRAGSQRWQDFLLLGLVLGLGYLAKTFMLSIAIVILGVCLILIWRIKGSKTKLLLSTGIFLLIVLPFIFLISEKKGKFTIGEAGTVTYLRYVHGVPFPHWQGDPENQIEPAHPSRQVYLSPPVYEFRKPIGGTYPISADPSYWFEGIDLPFNLRNQLARVFTSSLFYLDLFFQKQGVLLACLAALYWMGQKQQSSIEEVVRRWALVIPAVIAFGLYGLVLVTGRYIGVFVLLFWADILANVSMTNTAKNRKWIKVLSVIAMIGLLANIVLFNMDGFTRLNPSIQSSIGEKNTPRPTWPGEVAQTLQQLGIKEGDEVGVIGYGFDSFWARLARVKIIAQMLDEQAGEFWVGDDQLRKEVLQAFASTGAKAVVAEYVPTYAAGLESWSQVGNSSYYIYSFEE